MIDGDGKIPVRYQIFWNTYKYYLLIVLKFPDMIIVTFQENRGILRLIWRWTRLFKYGIPLINLQVGVNSNGLSKRELNKTPSHYVELTMIAGTASTFRMKNFYQWFRSHFHPTLNFKFKFWICTYVKKQKLYNLYLNDSRLNSNSYLNPKLEPLPHPNEPWVNFKFWLFKIKVIF